MVTYQQAVWFTIIIFTLAFVGLAYIITGLTKRLKEVSKPKVKYNNEQEKMKALYHMVRHLEITERLELIHFLLGNCNCLLRLEDGGIYIEGVGRSEYDQDDYGGQELLKKYTG